MWIAYTACCYAIFVSFLATATTLSFKSSESVLGLTTSSNGMNLVLSLGATKKLAMSPSTVSFTPGGFIITWATESPSAVLKDCFDLKKGEVNWYGGPERWTQEWPVEKLKIDGSLPYVVRSTDNFAVVERYWLNSLGAYIFVDDRAPLFVDQNNEEDGKICFIAKLDDLYSDRNTIYFNYTIVAEDDPKTAHLHAVKNRLGKPKGHPDERMVKTPIWTTWAKYKRDINDDTVLAFAQDILDHGYKGGQIEIDDNWETCYGAQEFNPDRFANISNTVSAIKKMGFRVTLWVHPFVNNDCDPVVSEGKEKGYFQIDANGNTNSSWWDGIDANQVDFTNPDAAQWYSARLKKLQENPGIDSFKFDAGEVTYGPQQPVSSYVNAENTPNVFTGSYIRNCAEFGDLIEVRSAWRTQDLPIFTRMIDKESSWTTDNGLRSLVTTLLQMNMNGYSMVLPDMIGGNGYEVTPTLELLIRWTQANTFMPAMQFSYLPWDFPSEDYYGEGIVTKFVELHDQYSDEIIKAMEANIENGTPVNAPIWWIDPTDSTALANDNEFLLGENILVAPILDEGATSRDVYLPKGSWKDGNSNQVYEGPMTVINYSAQIDILPFFIKQ
ncbi:hypothetical protein NQ318_002872 [Aromia moschata]|uniref:Glycoside hydrolase family 31 n=1 Tax=Aromia moschata TaxID=1265417 RepID=A0AAV8Y8P6_9CUCU|nr:hypothetical protein NQ318_002872 [Aromia moschata]